MRVRIFPERNDVKYLENTVNSWLSENPDVEICHVVQSETDATEKYGWSMTLTIFYKRSGESEDPHAGIVER